MVSHENRKIHIVRFAMIYQNAPAVEKVYRNSGISLYGSGRGGVEAVFKEALADVQSANAMGLLL